MLPAPAAEERQQVVARPVLGERPVEGAPELGLGRQGRRQVEGRTEAQTLGNGGEELVDLLDAHLGEHLGRGSRRRVRDVRVGNLLAQCHRLLGDARRGCADWYERGSRVSTPGGNAIVRYA